jgi:FtsZ-binding cell division protein ZapB
MLGLQLERPSAGAATDARAALQGGVRWETTVRCEYCGVPVLPDWDYCRACGADLTHDANAASGRGHLRSRLSLRPLRGRLAGRWRSRARSGRLAELLRLVGHACAAVPSRIRPRGPGRGWTVTTPRWPRERTLLMLAVTTTLVAALIAVSIEWSAARRTLAETRASLAQARVAADAATAAAARRARTRSVLQATIDAGTTAQTALENEAQAAQQRAEALQRTSYDAQTQLEAATTQVAALQERVRSLQDDLDQADAHSAVLQHDINVLTQCLDGQLVAMQFGRNGYWSSTDRALAAVADACAEAQKLL